MESKLKFTFILVWLFLNLNLVFASQIIEGIEYSLMEFHSNLKGLQLKFVSFSTMIQPSLFGYTNVGQIFNLISGESIHGFKDPLLSDIKAIDNNTLLLVKNHQLGFIDPLEPNPKAYYNLKLPAQTQKILLSQGKLFAYSVKGGIKDRLYIYHGNSVFKKILDLPQKIDSLYAADNRILIGMKGKIYAGRLGQKFQLVFHSALITEINSLIFDSTHELIYFSTKTGVYALRYGIADLLTQGLAGFLSLTPKGLIITSSIDKKLFRLVNLNSLLVKHK